MTYRTAPELPPTTELPQVFVPYRSRKRASLEAGLSLMSLGFAIWMSIFALGEIGKDARHMTPSLLLLVVVGTLGFFSALMLYGLVESLGDRYVLHPHGLEAHTFGKSTTWGWEQIDRVFIGSERGFVRGRVILVECTGERRQLLIGDALGDRTEAFLATVNRLAREAGAAVDLETLRSVGTLTMGACEVTIEALKHQGRTIAWTDVACVERSREGLQFVLRDASATRIETGAMAGVDRAVEVLQRSVGVLLQDAERVRVETRDDAVIDDVDADEAATHQQRRA